MNLSKKNIGRIVEKQQAVKKNIFFSKNRDEINCLMVVISR